MILADAGTPLTWSADGSRYFAVDAKKLNHVAEYDWLADGRPRLRSFPTPYASIYVHSNCLKWSPDRKSIAFHRNGWISLAGIDAPDPRVTFIEFSNGTMLTVNAEGHYRATRGVSGEIAYLVRTENGQQVLTPAEFESKHGWKNDPERVRPLP